MKNIRCEIEALEDAENQSHCLQGRWELYKKGISYPSNNRHLNNFCMHFKLHCNKPAYYHHKKIMHLVKMQYIMAKASINQQLLFFIVYNFEITLYKRIR